VIEVVVVAHQLASDLGHAIDRDWTQDGILGYVVLNIVLAEGADRAGSKYLAIELASHLEDVKSPKDVKVPGDFRLLLAAPRQQRGQVVDCGDLVLLHDIGQLLLLHHINLPVLADLGSAAVVQIRHDYIFYANHFLEGLAKLCAYLTICSGD